jgi:hypothetical protein
MMPSILLLDLRRVDTAGLQTADQRLARNSTCGRVIAEIHADPRKCGKANGRKQICFE